MYRCIFIFIFFFFFDKPKHVFVATTFLKQIILTRHVLMYVTNDEAVQDSRLAGISSGSAYKKKNLLLLLLVLLIYFFFALVAVSF
jgi:hypothetical protein